MRPGIIIRYNASAGSGKTYELAGIYLKSLFRDPKSYRNILAVTFTNKATAEMKERILHNLYLLSRGKECEYSEFIKEATGKTEEMIRKEAIAILNHLLHDYSRFSVGTIDSFFQKVLRSFARESGLQAGFNVILDSDMILIRAVDELLMDAENDTKLLNWLIEFGNREIIEGKSWNLKTKILSLGEEIFKERYRILHDKGYINEDKDQLREAINDMYAFKNSFREKLGDLAQNALDILRRNGVEENMLYLKSNSIIKFLTEATKDIPGISFRAVQAAAYDDKYFSGNAPAPELEAALADGLDRAIKSFADEYQHKIILYNSVKLVLDNLFTLGILNDIASKTRELLNEENKFLLSDAGDILRRIIATDQAPFIYEKMGNRYKNFMIDEFQDTSKVQWENFLPLINNSIAEGEDSLVVGDVKQSIYRWRNSDWEIFDRLSELFHPESFETIVLGKNWRSSANIIKFNNNIFSELPARVEENLELEDNVISRVYADVVQQDPGKFGGGYVRMKMYESAEEGKQRALDDLPAMIEEIQDEGYRACDIGILVRTKNEGQEVIDRITSHASEKAADSKYSYQVISQDSLMLRSSPVIIFLVSVLKYLINKEDKVNSAVMYQHYLLSIRKNVIDRPLFIDGNDTGIKSAKHAEDFENFLDTIRYLSVYEIIDRLIDYAGLNNIDSAKPYLNTLQNCILEFAGTETNDIPAFLEWWDNEGQKRSVSSTEQSDAMQLMTIHKSKGLQFKVVVLPFISWTFKHEKNLYPILWIFSDHRLLNKLGAVPVKMKKDFLNTYFKDFYLEEEGKAAVDRLNILYVAFTRARECLYGNLLNTKNGKSAGSYLFDIFTGEQYSGDLHFKEYFDSESGTFSFGRVPVKPGRKEERPGNPVIQYPLVLNDDRLRLKLHGKSYFAGKKDQTGEKRHYGLLMHEILASIKTAHDVEDAVRSYLSKGIISRDEYSNIKAKIYAALDQEDVKEWFSEDVRVRSEKDILAPGGDIRRPDRIIFSKDRIIIVDFKFGNELPGHRRQVEEYKALLKQMAYDKVEAFLWYVELSKVVSV
ncbi:MAG: UvrD-helicase domain-containing protein [Bacteroidota bacterium]|nr:UvrD-helicase domain-containing protein [Bacteroidota bacterium]